MTTKTSVAKSKRTFAAIRPWLPIVAACTLLSAYSAKDGAPAPMLALSWRDKVEHFLVFGLLATLVIQALPGQIQGTRRWLIAFAMVSAFGLWDETIQHFNPARTGDPLDWLADSLGALTAVVLYSAVPWTRSIAHWSPIRSRSLKA